MAEPKESVEHHEMQIAISIISMLFVITLLLLRSEAGNNGSKSVRATWNHVLGGKKLMILDAPDISPSRSLTPSCWVTLMTELGTLGKLEQIHIQ